MEPILNHGLTHVHLSHDNGNLCELESLNSLGKRCSDWSPVGR